MYGIELWRLSEAQWKELDKIQNRQVFCKNIMGTPNCVAYGSRKASAKDRL